MIRVVCALLLLFISLTQTVRAVGPVKYWYASGGGASSCAQASGTNDPGVYLSWTATWACMNGGDTFHIKAGSYGVLAFYEGSHPPSGNSGITVPNGLSTSAPTIIEGEGAIGCALAESCNTTIGAGNNLEDPQYITIRNLAITSAAANDFQSGLRISASAPLNTNVIVDNVEFHHTSEHGTFTTSDANMVTYRNFSIRFPNQYGGQTTNDGGHGMYIEGDDSVIENCKLHDISGAISILVQVFDSTGGKQGTAIRAIVRNCEFYNSPNDALVVAAPNATVYNNIFRNSVRGFTHYGGSSTSTYGCNTGLKFHGNIVYSNQLGVTLGLFGSGCDGLGADMSNNIIIANTQTIDLEHTWFSTGSKNAGNCGSSCGSAAVSLAAITDCTVSTSDYHHKSGGSCINAGAAVSTRVCNGVCDIGPYETFGFSVASIGTSILDVTLGMSLNTPLSPASGITGFSVACTGTNCGTPAISTAVRLSDSVVRLNLSGIGGGSNACAAGQTWTVSYSPGNVKDTSIVGATGGQSMFAFSTQAVTNNCGGGTTPPPGTPLVYYKFDDGSGTTAVDTQGGDQNGTLVNSPAWVTGKYGGALRFAGAAVDDYVQMPYGSGVDPSTQSISICLGVLPSDPTSMATNTGIWGSAVGSGQSFYLSWDNTGTGTITYGFGVQSKSSGLAPSEFAISTVWTRICIVFDSAIDTATMYVNGVKGTSAQSVKTYTSFTLASNIDIGRLNGQTTIGGGFDADEFKLWTSALTDTDVTNDYLAWNPSGQPTTGTFAQVTHQWQKFYKMGSGAAESLGTAGGTVIVMAGSLLQLVSQTDCTVGDCDPISQRVVYSRNGGALLPLPDVLTSDNVKFAGTTADPSVVSGAVTCCLSGALTANNGTTVFTSSAIPNFDLTLNSSIVQRYAIQFGLGVTIGDTYCFKVQNQNGTAFTTYTPSAGACITIGASQMGMSQ